MSATSHEEKEEAQEEQRAPPRTHGLALVELQPTEAANRGKRVQQQGFGCCTQCTMALDR